MLVSSLPLFHFAAQATDTTRQGTIKTCQLYGSQGVGASFSQYDQEDWRLTSLTCAYRTFPATRRSLQSTLTEPHSSDLSCVDLLNRSSRTVAVDKFLGLCTSFFDISLATKSFFRLALRGTPVFETAATPASLVALAVLHAGLHLPVADDGGPSAASAALTSVCPVEQRRFSASLEVAGGANFVLTSLVCPGRVFADGERVELVAAESVDCWRAAKQVDLRLICGLLDDLHQTVEQAGEEQCVLRNRTMPEFGVSLVFGRTQTGRRWRFRSLNCNSSFVLSNNRFAGLADDVDLAALTAVRRQLRRIEARLNSSDEGSSCDRLRMSEYSGASFNNLCAD